MRKKGKITGKGENGEKRKDREWGKTKKQGKKEK